jgi:Caulimovirus viroplasmin
MFVRLLAPSLDFLVSCELKRIVSMGKDAFYAVGVGRKRGVYSTWYHPCPS